MNASGANRPYIIAAILALSSALLLARLVVLLMAARPDNAGISAFITLSDILVWPLHWIDNTQPVYGSRFERGTLIELVIVVVGLNITTRQIS